MIGQTHTRQLWRLFCNYSDTFSFANAWHDWHQRSKPREAGISNFTEPFSNRIKFRTHLIKRWKTRLRNVNVMFANWTNGYTVYLFYINLQKAFFAQISQNNFACALCALAFIVELPNITSATELACISSALAVMANTGPVLVGQGLFVLPVRPCLKCVSLNRMGKMLLQVLFCLTLLVLRGENIKISGDKIASRKQYLIKVCLSHT